MNFVTSDRLSCLIFYLTWVERILNDVVETKTTRFLMSTFPHRLIPVFIKKLVLLCPFSLYCQIKNNNGQRVIKFTFKYLNNGL